MAEFVSDENSPKNVLKGEQGQRPAFDRSISKRIHRRFETVESYVQQLGGSKGRVIEKILIANNGVAAVKAIRSIRRWAYEVFGDEKAISFIVMATPEDLRANAEYIRMGDVIVDVPGGSNNHNYANVTLIVELARLHGVHAVWAGWGHASENPVLPDTLERSNPPIKFIGPSGPPMRALGDKIGSTIIAQSAGVPCIGWNGNHVKATYNKELGTLDEQAFDDACIHSVAEAEKAADEIGFPIMIKASEGGGGKGIRRVDTPDQVANSYRQVCGEVPGSPIFIMRLSSNSRHLEVQLLADEYGDAVALNGRDCSVQRRHQKIIEEGPPVAALPEVWTQMEKAAVALAKAVHYTNAGTVEYLYSESEAKFYFLELNPRLQVEHPVTEMITNVNLPAAQLQVAMGIPLHNIPEIRELYGRNRFEDEPRAESSRIPFDTAQRLAPSGHCVAVRITAENAEAGFKPTSGGIQELNFRSTPNVWGYFSMDSSGSVHEFADSQFGHLFASGSDREQARRNMVLALKELSIRGDISTTVDYISKLIELEDFVANHIDTGWLDSIIKENVDGMGAAESVLKTRRTSVKIASLHDHTHVAIAATIVASDLCQEGEQTFLDLMDKGQLPPRNLLKMEHAIELILNDVKYKLTCTRNGSNSYSISVTGAEDHNRVVSNVRTLSDGGYLIAMGGKSHVAYLTNKGDSATGMRLSVDGKTIAFSPDYDPSSLRTDVAGKLVKKLKAEGDQVKKGEPYCEIEVMKMFMPLKVEESGTLSWNANEGAALAAGDLLATIELDNPENVSTAVVFAGDLAVEGWGTTADSSVDAATMRPHLMLRNASEIVNAAMSGYSLSSDEIEAAFSALQMAVTDATLPVYEIEEQLSVLSGRIPAPLFNKISQILNDFKKTCQLQAGSGAQMKFPAEQVATLLQEQAESYQDAAEKTNFVTLTSLLTEAVSPYTKSTVAGVHGSERALIGFISLLRQWSAVERWFYEGKTYADAVENLRRANKSDSAAVLAVCRAHEQLSTTVDIVTRIVSAIGDGWRVDFEKSTASAIGKRLSVVAGAASLPLAMPAISEIGAMGNRDDYAEVALRARKVLMQESMPSLEQRRQKVIAAAKDLSGSDVSRRVQDLLAEHIPIVDVLFPLIKSAESSQDSVGLLELYLRHVYRPYTLKDVEKDTEQQVVKFTFSNKRSEGVLHSNTSVTSMAELSRVVSSGSISSMMSDVSEATESSNRSSIVSSHNKERIPQFALRTGLCVLLENIEDLASESKMEALLKQMPQYTGEAPKFETPVNVLYFFVTGSYAASDEKEDDTIGRRCEELVQPYVAKLQQADIRRLSFIFDQTESDHLQDSVPGVFTLRTPEFKEDALYRRIDPSLGLHLELHRVAANFRMISLGSRHTPTCHVHMYEATPKSAALSRDKKANKAPRVFARALSFDREFTSASFERMLADALNAMDLCDLKSKSDNHLFLNLVSDFEKAVLDPVVVEEVVAGILKRHGERLGGLGIIEVETCIVCCLSESSPPIAIRLFASNPTGFVQVMNTYVEAADEDGGERMFKLIGGTRANLASAGDSSWDGLPVNTPYPLTRPFDAQRKAALRSSDTVYCYDLPALFEAAVEQQWADHSKKSGIEGGTRAAAGPLMVMYTTELVVKNIADENGPWTMQDYLDGNLELVQENRGAGANDVGMVAWLVVLKTVEYPNGRQVVLIANDITFKAGSFGTREDVVFKLASEFARENRIPRLYIAANSGARIGLADSIKKAYKVAFKDSSNPDNGFDFLYLEKDDYATLKDDVSAELTTYEGREVYRMTDIIGSEPDLGVENLKGSGLIAGETSVAYDDIFTLTIVLGRTVGIGAYLVRLGQRTIQKSSASPIILTGYQALNKLMGVDVYSTNDQLGGPGIMYPNGVSHVVEPDHLRAVTAAVDWLSFVPSTRGGLLPITDIRGVDEIERPVQFKPKPGVPYDPRLLLTGGEDEMGNWASGFFDRGSFTESLAGWAKTVVVGRARLGGIPMGVIATENRTAEAIKPADPADVKASEAVIQEAGCVWFPNSAYKTAQAIKDFHVEDLPLIVFANWRGFSGGQRDMFDEVLKYGSLIVDAFVAYEQPVFVFIPPFAEVRGGAWVVLDASINSAVMEMYAAKGTARGGVLEANGAASVKYRTKDLIATMHRLDSKLQELDAKLAGTEKKSAEEAQIKEEITKREQVLLPVYEQISVQFCELHDTPGRMKAVGVIENDVEWEESRSFFYWRLRRKIAEFDLRKQLIWASKVGRGVKPLTPLEATGLIKGWFTATPNMTEALWKDDKAVISWMTAKYGDLEQKILAYNQAIVAQEVFLVTTAGGKTAQVGTAGIVEGLGKSLEHMRPEQRKDLKLKLTKMLANLD